MKWEKLIGETTTFQRGEESGWSVVALAGNMRQGEGEGQQGDADGEGKRARQRAHRRKVA
jgi:hypothetical protein